MGRLRMSVVVVCLVGVGCCGPPKRSTTFDRRNPVLFVKRVAIPDEAVIYMQNLALMRSHLRLGAVKHVELVLPPRIIVESLQLRIGERQIQEFNVKHQYTPKLGAYTRVRIRHIDRYLQSGQPLLVEYLTWGVYWSAQYRVDILPKGQLRLQLGAMIQNHWYDLSHMKLTLVAGWVGVSPNLRRASLSKRPGAALARLGRVIPWKAIPPVLRRGFRSWSKSSVQATARYKRTRAFDSRLVTKYRIKMVDNTARRRQSNFQKQFASYYMETKAMRQSSRALRNRVDGYHLYRNLRINLNRRHKSYLRMASVLLASEPKYLWPADQGDSVYTVYKVPNQTKILLPAGTAWIYRDGVFVGHDLHHWTPVGGHSYLTTTNDGGVAVKKPLVFLKDNTRRLLLTVRSLSKTPVRVEIFEANPLWRGKGTLTYSHPPKTANEKGRYHRWLLRIKPGGSQVLRIDYRPAPPKKVQPRPVLRRAPAAAPRPVPRRLRRRRYRRR